MPSSHNPRDSPARRERRRRTHHRTDSNGELLGRYDREPGSPSPTKSRPRRDHRERRSSRAPESEYTQTTTTALSSGQLAQLDKLNRKLGWNEYEGISRQQPQDDDEVTRAEHDAEREREREQRERDRERRRQEHRERKRRRREEERVALAAEGGSLAYEHPKSRRKADRDQRRVASGQYLERGRGASAYYSDKDDYSDDIRRRVGPGSSDLDYDEDQQRKKKRRKKIFIGVGVVVVLLAIIIPVAVVLSNKNHSSSSSSSGAAAGGDNSTAPSNSNLNGISEDDIPKDVQGTWLDPFTWYDTDDFNVTYTAATVGGLTVMGLNSTWDDSKRANDNVPPLNEPFQYGTMPVRGVNVGGWLSIEPFITPSFFSGYSTHDNVVDEYTLTQKLGASNAKTTVEKHYSSFVSESTFADIQAAGFDHVRIPFSYWAVITYDGDPYVANISWRYLLRGIEWARKYGLRINLDLHGAPGSQNGWNHSGRQGTIGWLNGTDGDLNGDRTIDIHKQLSTFFTQPRYKNIVTMYGLVNEPRMVELDTNTVLTWTQKAVDAVQGNNFTGIIVFGDGFMGLDNWQGKLQNDKNLLLDVHQYVIFNVEQIVLNHHDKINFACGGWTAQAQRSQNKATGFGPTLCGEWSQADTDCAEYLNNVGVGSRWEGTLNMVSTPGGSSDGSVLTPTCPTKNNPRCSCDGANADPSSYSDDYKQWLLMFAEAQMHSFEQGWGWFYWTWQTESATQWSYKDALAAGIMPKSAYQRDFNCSSDIPQFSNLPENY
ncbi:glycoside hydrolase family 5 protein [Zasmidium cellare ATCC 36951]|uniref:glucan 1,3-beta-glucosidase n=1 Tax=Zasmidium cellare ATCC 36951 TaxID=1080233 RepID=A0A6A6D0K9_ZASCE|nr:glycoside hydrolase family 5 protein [Zasmidium cellare ATCC 36951]KAF2172553.1 glycoside hydrolase family 5 protein [Zasmidium cellare ATCC 36951]